MDWSAHIYGVSTDVLGSTPCFLIGHIGLTDCIEEGGFTMIEHDP